MAPPGSPPNRGFVLGLMLLLGIATTLVLVPFLSYVVLGLLVAFFLHPVFNAMNRRVNKPVLNASLLLLVVFLLLLTPIVLVTWEVVTEVTVLTKTLTPTDVLATVDLMLGRITGFLGLPPPSSGTTADLLHSAVPTAQAWLSAQIPSVLTFVANLFIGLFILSFVVFYGLVDGARFLGYVKSLIPLSPFHTNLLFSEVEKTVGAVFYGQVAAGIAQGVLGGLGFLLFGVPNVFFWGFVMIVLSVIPVLGSFLVWGPAVLYLLAIGKTWQGIALLAWSVILVSNVDNVLKPRLIGKRAQMHPVVVLVGVLGGIVAFGFIGFLIGPLVLSLFVAVLNFWRDDYLPHYRPPEEEALPPT